MTARLEHARRRDMRRAASIRDQRRRAAAVRAAERAAEEVAREISKMKEAA